MLIALGAGKDDHRPLSCIRRYENAACTVKVGLIIYGGYQGKLNQNGSRDAPTLGRERNMSSVRVLVGTHKGAFILTSDGKREKWEVSGPHFAGWEMYHLKGSPADPNRLYASQTSGWFGQIIQRSSDGGKTWETPGGEQVARAGRHARRRRATNSFTTPPRKPANRSPRTSGTTARSIPGSSSASGISNRRSPIRIRSTPGWKTPPCSAPPTAAGHWHELAGLRGHGTGPKWQPGAGGMCLHTIILDPSDPGRIYIAISAAGAFRTDDGGKTWKPINRGLKSAIHSRPECRGRPLRSPHRHAPVAPERAVHAEALGRDAQRRRGRVVAGGQRELAHRLRFRD